MLRVLPFLLLAQAAGTAGSCGPSGPDPAGVTVQSVMDHPEAYLDQVVSVRGTLANEGKNYFTDFRLVLKGEGGRSIPVKPWLPAEVPPAMKPGPRPATLSQYLDKTVELTATVRHGELSRLGVVYFLEVKSARVLDSVQPAPDSW